jgi:hypothetical protein
VKFHIIFKKAREKRCEQAPQAMIYAVSILSHMVLGVSMAEEA